MSPEMSIVRYWAVPSSTRSVVVVERGQQKTPGGIPGVDLEGIDYGPELCTRKFNTLPRGIKVSALVELGEVKLLVETKATAAKVHSPAVKFVKTVLVVVTETVLVNVALALLAVQVVFVPGTANT